MASHGCCTGLVNKKGPAGRVLEQRQSRELPLCKPEQQQPEEPQQQYRVSLCPRHLPEAGIPVPIPVAESVPCGRPDQSLVALVNGKRVERARQILGETEER